MKIIKNRIVVLLVLCVIVNPLFSEADFFRLAPGAEAAFSGLLNNPKMVHPSQAKSLGRNWYTLEAEAHVFTDEVNIYQLSQVINDIRDHDVFLDGRRSSLSGTLVSRMENELIIDFISTTNVAMVQLHTPYRAVVRTLTNTDNQFKMEIRQTPEDIETNKKIRNFHAQRYAQIVNINGKDYVYVRVHTTMDVDTSILPGAWHALERNSGPTTLEGLSMIISGAKTKPAR